MLHPVAPSQFFSGTSGNSITPSNSGSNSSFLQVDSHSKLS